MFQKTDLVVSVSGRDKNRIFMIVDILDSEYVLIADGALRKLEKPKKKKIKHLRPAAYSADERILEKIREGQKITNAELRKMLWALVDVRSED